MQAEDETATAERRTTDNRQLTTDRTEGSCYEHNLARPALWRARVVAESGLRAGRGVDAGAGHWREHGHLLGRARGAVAPFALPAAGAVGLDARGCGRCAEPLGLLSKLR